MEVEVADRQMYERENRFHEMVREAMRICFGEEMPAPRNEFNDEGYMYGLPGYWNDEGVIRLGKVK